MPEKYVVIHRARFNAISGPVNLPYGTAVQADEDYICLGGSRICAVRSKKAHEYFARDSDGNGLERGKLTAAILNRLERRDKGYQERWNKVWESPLCQKYRREDHEDFWLWGHSFYEAPVEDLREIAKMIGAKI